jgi:hypothetical protein
MEGLQKQFFPPRWGEEMEWRWKGEGGRQQGGKKRERTKNSSKKIEQRD